MQDKGGQRQQNHLSPAQTWETRGTKADKAKSSQPSIQTRHGRQGGARRQNKVISAQHPDLPWETRGDKERRDKAKSSLPSIQTCHGKQGVTKGDKAKSSQPSIQTRRGRQGGTKDGNHIGSASLLCKNSEYLTAKLLGELHYSAARIQTDGQTDRQTDIHRSTHFANTTRDNITLHWLPYSTRFHYIS